MHCVKKTKFMIRYFSVLEIPSCRISMWLAHKVAVGCYMYGWMNHGRGTSLYEIAVIAWYSLKYLSVHSEMCSGVLWWCMVFRKLLSLCFKLQPCREWSWYNKWMLSISCWHFSLNYGDTPCKTELLLCALLLLLATLHCKQKHYLCCSLNRNFTECMSTAVKDSHSLLDYRLRAPFPCSRVIHCMLSIIAFQNGVLTAQKVLVVD